MHDRKCTLKLSYQEIALISVRIGTNGDALNIRFNRNKSNESGRMSSQHVIQFMIILCIRPAILLNLSDQVYQRILIIEKYWIIWACWGEGRSCSKMSVVTMRSIIRSYYKVGFKWRGVICWNKIFFTLKTQSADRCLASEISWLFEHWNFK